MYLHRISLILAVVLCCAAAPLPARANDQPQPPECVIKDAKLPADFTLFAAGGYRGRALDFPIEKESTQLAGQVDITVNSPDKPVALMFSNYEATIWNVSWTPGTKIVAVYTSGYYRQAVAGIDDDVPVGTMTYKSLMDKGVGDSPCFLMAMEPDMGSEIGKRDMAAYAVFNKKPDKSYLIFAPRGAPPILKIDNGSGHYEAAQMPAGSDATKLTIGAPVAPGTQLLSNSKTAPETFREKSAPQLGQEGFEDAVKNGVLRKATMEDADEFVKVYVASLPAPNKDVPPIKGRDAGADVPFPRINNITNSYVVLKAFEVPLAVKRGNIPNLFVAKGAPLPTGNPNGAQIFDLNTGKCMPVFACPDQQSAMARRDNPSETRIPHVAADCFSELPKLPLSAEVIAGGGGGRQLKFPIDKTGKMASQIDVRVNHPGKPVALLLSAYNPTIWNFSWTKGTTISAVVIGGYDRQVVAGLDEKTPLLIRTYESLEAGKNRSCDYVNLDDIEKVNPFSREIFGKPATLFVPTNRDGVIEVGDDAPAAAYTSSSKTTPESYHDKNAPLTGELGIKDALDKGLIRRATPEDYRAWATAWLAAHPDGHGGGEIPPTMNVRRKGAEIPLPPFFMAGATYVVLKPFTIPDGAGGEYIVAKGVPMPKPNAENRNVIYSMDDANCTPTMPCLYNLMDQ